MFHRCYARPIGTTKFVLIFVGVSLFDAPVVAQIAITEVMANPSGSESSWEWIEIHNTSGQLLDLDGFVLDDDQFNPLTAANIRTDVGNTLMPAGGVAVLYDADDLSAQRFAETWREGITLIGVTNFPGLLNSGERIGLWSSLELYGQRNFDSADADLDFSAENIFPIPNNGQSIAWTGAGSTVDPFLWVASEAGDDFGAYTSTSTSITTQINSTDDIANPGQVPSVPTQPGLIITEIMYNPASADADFEFVEVFNNTGAAIDFALTPYILDDSAGTLPEENVTDGLIPANEVGVLFDSGTIGIAELEAAWGTGRNFIPVSGWGSLNNSGGDTVGLWNDLGAYESDRAADSTAGALAAVTYQNDTDGWPNDDGAGSIYLVDLNADADTGSSWQLSGGEGPEEQFQSTNASPIVTSTEDNPGTDVGSPGFVPGVVTGSNDGDYNGDGTIGAADYTLWRDSLGDHVSEFSGADGDGSGFIDAPDYEHWRSQYLDSMVGGSISAPEPASNSLMMLAAVAAWCRRRKNDRRLSRQSI